VVDGAEEEHGDDERQESTTMMGWSGLPTVQQGLLGIPPRACDMRRCEEGVCHKRGSKGGLLTSDDEGKEGATSGREETTSCVDQRRETTTVFSKLLIV
jgi:hypothetical protein